MVEVMTRLYAELAQSYIDHARCIDLDEVITGTLPLVVSMQQI